jgi:glyoxylase-like metal-dependent hydrolase (beta-lactamase superfamily II)
MQTKKMHHLCVGGIATNCWIYPLEQTSGFSPCAVIDPGEEGSRIIARLDQLKLLPAYILLTHGHFDHIAAVPALAAEYGKRKIKFEIAIHAADAEYLGPDSYQAHCRSFQIAAGNTAYIDSRWEDLPAADRLLAEGDRIGPFTVLTGMQLYTSQPFWLISRAV